MLNALKKEANITYTINGAVSNRSSLSDCLDFFALAGTMRRYPEKALEMFFKAYCESPDYAVKALFYTRDILYGCGERCTFRNLIRLLAYHSPESVVKNIRYIPEFGRFDDVIALFDTPCEDDAMNFIKEKFEEDMQKMNNGKSVSLLAKWLPSVNCSDKKRKETAGKIRRALKLSEKEYRRRLSALRSYIDITETRLCKKDYSFSYEHVPSKAIFKYRKAFLRNDNRRYTLYLNAVSEGKATMHTATLYPYEIVRKCLEYQDAAARKNLEAAWRSLEDVLPEEMKNKNAIAVVDGSGSMYSPDSPVSPISVAISLAIYFSQKNKGCFSNHFITFSRSPQLVEIKGSDILEKVHYCMSFDEIANTDIEKTFRLILNAALANRLKQEEMPEYMYIFSDMEFDECSNYDMTVYECMKELYAENGYTIPQIIFWNVNTLSCQFPVRKDETGTVMISGYSPNLFRLCCFERDITPLKFMTNVLDSPRYSVISA